MKSWALAAILVSVGAFMACSDDSTGSGGSGAGSSSSGTGGKDASSSSSSTSDTSSTSTGPSICDDTETECGGETRTACWKCASEGACKTDVDACTNNESCLQLITCFDPCPASADPTACTDACRTQNVEGAAIYDQIIKCITCDQCPTACKAVDEPLCAAP